ncbi:hypothetical protein GYMLUDRAFT_245299 [Collybiopsis luxurians FD-317 M1]|uniref:Unplaced genomic scaffold GYMLUscaffold_32, whole genome shotgun sequence n=1 Tax=Collybiopsis luxurians FD-317 M1 TaxID=944289 RepID=A0A0D0C9Q0_9AGAR|nr:hypothetical protein GYMLUDRAFT_245299 [Collybiopsis luxurians FD-317 M1]
MASLSRGHHALGTTRSPITFYDQKSITTVLVYLLLSCPYFLPVKAKFNLDATEASFRTKGALGERPSGLSRISHYISGHQRFSKRGQYHIYSGEFLAIPALTRPPPLPFLCLPSAVVSRVVSIDSSLDVHALFHSLLPKLYKTNACLIVTSVKPKSIWMVLKTHFEILVSTRIRRSGGLYSGFYEYESYGTTISAATTFLFSPAGNRTKTEFMQIIGFINNISRCTVRFRPFASGSVFLISASLVCVSTSALRPHLRPRPGLRLRPRPHIVVRDDSNSTSQPRSGALNMIAALGPWILKDPGVRSNMKGFIQQVIVDEFASGEGYLEFGDCEVAGTMVKQGMVWTSQDVSVSFSVSVSVSVSAFFPSSLISHFSLLTSHFFSLPFPSPPPPLPPVLPPSPFPLPLSFFPLPPSLSSSFLFFSECLRFSNASLPIEY